MVIQARKPSAKASKAHKPANGSTKSKMLRSKSVLKAPPPKQQKTKSAAPPPKKKRPVYTAEELGVPALNMITPVGAVKPRGKKKGKVFVDDGVRYISCCPFEHRYRIWRMLLRSPIQGPEADYLLQPGTGEHDDDTGNGKCG